MTPVANHCGPCRDRAIAALIRPNDAIARARMAAFGSRNMRASASVNRGSPRLPHHPGRSGPEQRRSVIGHLQQLRDYRALPQPVQRQQSIARHAIVAIAGSRLAAVPAPLRCPCPTALRRHWRECAGPIPPGGPRTHLTLRLPRPTSFTAFERTYGLEWRSSRINDGRIRPPPRSRPESPSLVRHRPAACRIPAMRRYPPVAWPAPHPSWDRRAPRRAPAAMACSRVNADRTAPAAEGRSPPVSRSGIAIRANRPAVSVSRPPPCRTPPDPLHQLAYQFAVAVGIAIEIAYRGHQLAR